MGNYVMENDIRGFKVSGCYVDLDTYSTTEINTEISLAEQLVESITNDIFYSKAETNLFDGTGHVRLFFFPTVPYKLISVTSLKELDLDGTVLDTFVADNDYKRYDYYVETSRAFDGELPRRRFGTGGVWPKGQKNIQIEGLWGVSVTPEAIKRAVILLVLERLKPGSTKIQPIGIREAEWDDFKIEFQQSSKTGDTTGFPYIDRLLEEYTNHISLFQVIPEDRQIYENPTTLG